MAVAGVFPQWWEDSGRLFIPLVISANALSLSQALIVVQGRAIDPNSDENSIREAALFCIEVKCVTKPDRDPTHLVFQQSQHPSK